MDGVVSRACGLWISGRGLTTEAVAARSAETHATAGCHAADAPRLGLLSTNNADDARPESTLASPQTQA